MRGRLFPGDVLLDDFGRHTAYQRIGRHVGGHYGPRRDYGATADAYTFKYSDVEADPYMILDHNGRRDDVIAVDRMVVAIAEGDAARNDDAMPNGNGGEAVDGGIVVDIAAAECELGAIVDRKVASGHQVKMPLDGEVRILGQLEFGRVVPQPGPLATQFEFALTDQARGRRGENAHIRVNIDQTAFFSMSELRSPEPGKKRSLVTDIQEVFQRHFKIIPNARPDEWANSYLTTWERLSR